MDLHDFARLPVDLQFRVPREGEVLVDKDSVRRVRLEIRTLNAFNNFRPYLQRLRTATRDRLAAEVDPERVWAIVTHDLADVDQFLAVVATRREGG